MKKRHLPQLIFFFITLFLNVQIVYTQQNSIDSLILCIQKADNNTRRVDLLNQLSDRYIRSNTQKAKDIAQEALSLADSIGYKNGIMAGLNNIGNVYNNQGNYGKANEYYEMVLKMAKEFDNKIGMSYCYNNIGVTYSYQGNYDKAIEYYKMALKINEEYNIKEVIINLLNIGVIYNYQGNYDNATKYYEKALKIAEEHNDKNGISSGLNNIGLIYDDQGNYDKAIEYYQKSLKIAEELGDKIFISNCYTNIGITYMHLENNKEALKYYEKSLKIDSELEDKKGVSICLFNIGGINKCLNNYQKAREYYQKALKIKEELGDRNGISNCFHNIGELYLEQKEFDKAFTHLKKALEIRQEIGAQNGVIKSFNLLGRSYLKQGQPKKSLQYYQKALMSNLADFNDSIVYHNPMKLDAISKPDLLETLGNKANVFYLLYNKENIITDIETSVSTYELVFKLIYEMRNDFSHESTKLLLSENTKKYFGDAVQTAMTYYQIKPSQENKIFEYIEKSKSSTLGAYLSDLKLKQNWNIADTTLEKERDIAIYRRFYETEIQKAEAEMSGYDTALVQYYQEELFYYSKQYDSLINVFKNKYPDYYKLKYEQKVASIDDIQNHLDNNSVLINYFVADTSLFVATITKSNFAYKVIKIDSLFKQKIIDYHIDIRSAFTELELKTSSELYQTVIAPVEKLIENKNNLIIIPDEDLYYLPFETLCKNASLSGNLQKVDFLIKKYSISYHHSATLWLNSIAKSKKQTTKTENFIGFAPVFDKKTNNGFIVAREWVPDTAITEISTRSISSDFNNFNSLPYSEEEVNSIVKLFSKKGKEAKGYFYREANEKNFKQNVQKYKYVHIASHSFTNDQYPSLSGIAFSQPDTSLTHKEKVEDGILYASEAYNLTIPNADLIVLSSCKSGLGKLVKGEGFLSLSRGFLYSGTPNIIFSLWNVKDEQSKDLMIEFYKNVLKRKNYARALREAKLKLLKNKKTASPKYWAAWILLGI